ncbi:MAG: alpha-galactosidase [Caulobacterales bacterium]|nr:alpha-galactosidase [Caulobacterales bacterium]
MSTEPDDADRPSGASGPRPPTAEARAPRVFTSLRTDEAQLIVATDPGARPQIVYWGQALAHASPEELALLSARQRTHGAAAFDVPSSLSNELGAGVPGPPGFIAHRRGVDWAAVFRVRQAEQEEPWSARITCEDDNTRLRAVYDLAIDPVSHVLTARTAIENADAAPLTIDWCAALCLPLEAFMDRLMSFSGRWALEFQRQTIPAFTGGFVRENKSGRTSHDSFPGLIAMAEATNETAGPAAGFHLGWSGDSRVRVDRQSDGRAFVQMGELLHPGEMELAGGERYVTPTLFAAWSESGLNTLSQRLHAHVRRQVLDSRARAKARPVHFNTWEAVYFDHSEERVMALAEKAASLGVERFVLDDGWFGGRRHERAGLGDWRVSREVYPNGLAPLADKVRALGMELGLWFEPEMVNADSELYRKHPDWILRADGVEQVPSRHQYVLDLTRPEVSAHLFKQIDAVISEYKIAYIKWDMNREIHHPGSAGRGAAHRQTHAVYALMERLRARHPGLEIESCSSGGARSDYGVLRYADRIWPSDCNDALERQTIQRGASYFFPLCVTGAHVGPRVSHTTGRVHAMEFRAATALFGHMGLEIDLLDESEADLAMLKRAIAVHKQHRALIHDGDVVRLDTAPCVNALGVVAADRSEGLFSVALTESQPATLPERVRFAGLAPDTRYRLRIIWPTRNISVTGPSIVEAARLLEEGTVFSGEALQRHGIQPPLTHPENCLVYHVTAQ